MTEEPRVPTSVGEADVLWCLHVLGPDDVHPAPDRATAQLWAAQWTVWNQRRAPEPRLFDPVMSWIVAEWPHDAASHAAGLAQSVHNNLFPVDPLASPSIPALDERERLREALTQAFAIAHEAPELNMSNYDHDDVAAINGAMIELHGLLGASIRPGDAG